jgi:hypothetical protein
MTEVENIAGDITACLSDVKTGFSKLNSSTQSIISRVTTARRR